MITLAVTILLIVLFLVLTRKQRSEYYEEDIGPSDIEMGPSEDAPVRPRSLVHKLKKGVEKIEEKRTQDVILHDLFLKQVDMKAAKKQGTQDEIKDEIQDSIDEELKFMKKYTELVEDHIYEKKTLPEDETYDIVAESAHDALRADINEQLVVKGKEYKKRQDEELALQTEQRRKMDQEVSDTRIVKQDLGDGLKDLEELAPQIEADLAAVDAGKMPTTKVGQDAVLSMGDEAIMDSTPYTQKMASIFASASLAPDGGWNDGNADVVTPGAVNDTSPQERQKIIQFSEVGNVFEDYYVVQDPDGPFRGHFPGRFDRKPIVSDTDDPEYGKWKKQKVQMKISCGPTSPGEFLLGEPQHYTWAQVGWNHAGLQAFTDQLNSLPFGAGAYKYSYNDRGEVLRSRDQGATARRIDSLYSNYYMSRPERTQPQWSGSCVKPMYAATFQECADACKDSDECSAFSIEPIFDTERGHHAMRGIKRDGSTVADEEKYRFQSLTAGPETFDNGKKNEYKGKYWCKLQKYGHRRFDIGPFSGEAIFAKYEDGYLKDPLIKEHLQKKIDANSSVLDKAGNFEHPKFPRTCQDTPLDFENDGNPRGTTDYSTDGSLNNRKPHKRRDASWDPGEYEKEVSLPEDSARYSKAAWTPADANGVCKNNGKNELTAFPGRFQKDDPVDSSTQIKIGCPVQFIRTDKTSPYGPGQPRLFELVQGGWKAKIDRHRGDSNFEDAKPNPFHLGWANHGAGPGSNIVRNKVKMESDGRYSYAIAAKRDRFGNTVDENTLVDDDYRSLVLPGTRGIPKCPDGYAVRTENQPYCDPDTLTLSTPFAKCEPVLERGGCVAKESKYQNQCAALNEVSCTNHQFSSEELGLERFEPGGKNAASPEWAPQNEWQDNKTKSLYPDGSGKYRDPNVGLRAYKKYGKILGKDHRWNKYTMDGLPASDVCEWKPHTFYDGQVSRTTTYDGKQFWVLHKRGQQGAWTVGQLDEFSFQGPKWNWDAGGYDPTFNDWAKFFDDKGKIVLYNIDGSVNQEAVKYQAAVLEKMGGGFKSTEIPVVYFKMDEDTGGPLAKDLAEKAALGFFGDDVE